VGALIQFPVRIQFVDDGAAPLAPAQSSISISDQLVASLKGLDEMADRLIVLRDLMPNKSSKDTVERCRLELLAGIDQLKTRIAEAEIYLL
jgi:hypothetical protein